MSDQGERWKTLAKDLATCATTEQLEAALLANKRDQLEHDITARFEKDQTLASVVEEVLSRASQDSPQLKSQILSVLLGEPESKTHAQKLMDLAPSIKKPRGSYSARMQRFLHSIAPREVVGGLLLLSACLLLWFTWLGPLSATSDGLFSLDISQILEHLVKAPIPFLVSFVLGGVGAGIAKTPTEEEAPGLFRVLKYAAISSTAAVGIVAGAKVTEHFSIVDDPQVVFVGSGTVHRFLFGNAQESMHSWRVDGGKPLDSLALRQGAKLGERGVALWSFEGGSTDGVGLATFAYAHHAATGDEKRVALVAMDSAPLFANDGGLTQRAECELRQKMQSDNIQADSFLVVPLQRGIRPRFAFLNLHQELPASGLAATVTRDAGRITGLGFCSGDGGVLRLPVENFFGGGETSATASTLPESDGGCPVYSVSGFNFSLDLDHIVQRLKAEGKSPVVGAYGNYFSGESSAWKSTHCINCTPRDLALIFPVIQGKLHAFTCMALAVINGRSDKLQLAEYIDFAGCQQPGKEADCSCTPSSQATVLEGLSDSTHLASCRKP